MTVLIRPALGADVPTITDIYNEGGVATTASYDLTPVTVGERLGWLESHQVDGFPVLVADDDGLVVGFAGYSRFRDKAGYRHTVEHSVYVASSHQARGVGRLLLTALIDHARLQGMHAMIGVLDADNEASRNFHTRLGFVEVGRLPQVGHKFGRWLDAVLVQLTL